MIMVILALPALLMLCDRIICNTTLGMKHIPSHDNPERKEV